MLDEYEFWRSNRGHGDDWIEAEDRILSSKPTSIREAVIMVEVLISVTDDSGYRLNSGADRKALVSLWEFFSQKNML